METAPRDGTLIMVGDPDCGEFPMRWEPTWKNWLLPGVIGFWVMSDDSMTWSEHQGYGPTYWVPLPGDIQ
jgi:hypothetical protein